MKTNELVALHKALLILADEVDRICAECDIKYSLIGGSMLGAIRHKGFIPWDDDLDIGMLRTDYDKFLQACSTKLGDRFVLQTNENDPNYVYGFSKILLKNTSLIQFGHEKTKHKKGIYVDIFPYDNIPDNNALRSLQRNKNYILIKLLDRKFKEAVYTNSKIKKIIIAVLEIVASLFSTKKLIIMLNNNMGKYSDMETKCISAMSGFYGYDGETIPLSLFENVIKVPFEDREYCIVKEYDDFLTRYYGDYMKLPPVEKRRTHGFHELDFGPYEFLLNNKES